MAARRPRWGRTAARAGEQNGGPGWGSAGVAARAGQRGGVGRVAWRLGRATRQSWPGSAAAKAGRRSGLGRAARAARAG